jgi:hypothetical protein
LYVSINFVLRKQFCLCTGFMVCCMTKKFQKTGGEESGEKVVEEKRFLEDKLLKDEGGATDPHEGCLVVHLSDYLRGG